MDSQKEKAMTAMREAATRAVAESKAECVFILGVFKGDDGRHYVTDFVAGQSPHPMPLLLRDHSTRMVIDLEKQASVGKARV